MKLSTENSSIRRTKKIITLMLIITVAVGLLPLVSTTVDADSPVIPYVLAYQRNETFEVFVSDAPFYLYTSNKSQTNITSPTYPVLATIGSTYTLRILFNESTQQWYTANIEEQISLSGYRWGTSTTLGSTGVKILVYSGSSTLSVVKSFWKNVHIITNCTFNSAEINILGSVSDDLDQLPQGLTEDRIREIINEQLNTSTESGQTAQTVINNTTNQYNLYLSGNIDSTSMQQNVKSNIDTLSNLTPGTLLDAMQINNGLTYNQTIQDQLLNTASGNVQTMINGYQNTINSAITNYQNGTTSQNETVTIINQAITNLNNMIINGTAKTTADVNAVNAAINTANANLDSVTGYKDVSQEVSDKSQASDQEEMDYLDELTAETTATLEEIAPSQNFTGTQTGEAQQVLEIVWENEFVKRLLPMCAGFMVVCVVLGIRYKV